MADIDDAKRAKLEERLRLMLKKAETTTPAEAEMIMAQVEKLMMKLGIDDMMSFAREKRAEDIITVEASYDGVYAKAWVSMAFSIATALGDLECISSNVYTQGTYKKCGLKLLIMGHANDANRAKTLIDSLSLQCIAPMTEHMRMFSLRAPYATASQKYNEKRSFIVGFGRGAAERIKRTRVQVVQEATASEPGTALVLAERGTIVRAAFDQAHPRTTKTRGMQIHASGYEQGKAAGRQARTGESEVGNSSRRAIG